MAKFFGLVILQALDNAETVTQWRGEGTDASGGTNEGKALEGDAAGAGTLAFAGGDVEAEIFHCRVEDFFAHFTEPVDFVNEEDISWLEVNEETGNVAGSFEGRCGGNFAADIHFCSQDQSHCSFPKTGGTV